VVIDRAFRNAGELDDLVYGGRVQTLLADESGGGIEKPGACGCAVAAYGPCSMFS
jgi:hypothetical protein